LANHKSALKRDRQGKKNNLRNKAVKTNLKKGIKNLRAAIAKKDKKQSSAALKDVTVKLDKAVTKNVLHKNNASRKISRLTKQVNSL
jgi:small subunit ribosomal protein S20